MTQVERASQGENRVPSYAMLLRHKGFLALSATTVCSRLGEFSTQTALLLFVLERFHAPGLAASVMVCRLVPAVVVSPLVGALLDRMAPRRLIRADLATATAVLALLVLLDAIGQLSPWVLLTAVAAGSCTSPLSVAGGRSLVVKVLPEDLWMRANAVDSATYVAATLTGPLLSGAVVAAAGGRSALVVAAVVYGLGVVIVRGVPVLEAPPVTRSLLADTRLGLATLISNRALRNLTVVVALFNITNGVYELVVPIAAVRDYDNGALWVGFFFATAGVGGIVTGLITGHRDLEGREYRAIGASVAATGVGLALFALAGNPTMACLGMLMVGAAGGIFDVAFLSARQRFADPSSYGRVVTVSSAINLAGAPVGAAVVPVLLALDGGDRTGTTALILAGTAAVLLAAVVWVFPPRRD